MNFEGINLDESGKIKFESLPLIYLDKKQVSYSKIIKENDIKNCLNLIQVLCNSSKKINTAEIPDSFLQMLHINIREPTFNIEKIMVFILFLQI